MRRRHQQSGQQLVRSRPTNRSRTRRGSQVRGEATVESLQWAEEGRRRAGGEGGRWSCRGRGGGGRRRRRCSPQTVPSVCWSALIRRMCRSEGEEGTWPRPQWMRVESARESELQRRRDRRRGCEALPLQERTSPTAHRRSSQTQWCRAGRGWEEGLRPPFFSSSTFLSSFSPSSFINRGHCPPSLRELPSPHPPPSAVLLRRSAAVARP